jgi:hypothetical protein
MAVTSRVSFFNDISFSGDIHLNKEVRSLLTDSSQAFKHCDVKNGYGKFSICALKAPEYAHLTYHFLYLIHDKPQGDLKYGYHAFFNQEGKSSSIPDRFEAIDLTLTLVNQYESLLKIKEETKNDPQVQVTDWWEKNKERILTATSVGVAALGAFGCLASLLRGGPSTSLPLGYIPGHVIVGGGHMDAPLQHFLFHWDKFTTLILQMYKYN